MRCENQAAAPATMTTARATATPTLVAAPLFGFLSEGTGGAGGGGAEDAEIDGEDGAALEGGGSDSSEDGDAAEKPPGPGSWTGEGVGSGSSSRAARLPTASPAGSDVWIALPSRL